MATTGDRIRTDREATGWTQDKLAERAGGITKGFLSDLENNKRDVSAWYLLQIANALALSGAVQSSLPVASMTPDPCAGDSANVLKVALRCNHGAVPR